MTGVINGGFETGDFDRWEVGVIKPQLELPIITTNAHSGVYGAMLKGGAYIQQRYTTPIISVEYLQYWLRSAGADSLEVTVYFTKLTRSPHLLKGLFARGLGIQREEKDGWSKYVLCRKIGKDTFVGKRWLEGYSRRSQEYRRLYKESIFSWRSKRV